MIFISTWTPSTLHKTTWEIGEIDYYHASTFLHSNSIPFFCFPGGKHAIKSPVNRGNVLAGEREKKKNLSTDHFLPKIPEAA